MRETFVLSVLCTVLFSGATWSATHQDNGAGPYMDPAAGQQVATHHPQSPQDHGNHLYWYETCLGPADGIEEIFARPKKFPEGVEGYKDKETDELKGFVLCWCRLEKRSSGNFNDEALDGRMLLT